MSRKKETELTASLIGKTTAKAVSLVKKASFLCRIIRRDKNHFIVTMDLRGDRVNLEIDNNKVTKAYIG